MTKISYAESASATSPKRPFGTAISRSSWWRRWPPRKIDRPAPGDVPRSLDIRQEVGHALGAPGFPARHVRMDDQRRAAHVRTRGGPAPRRAGSGRGGDRPRARASREYSLRRDTPRSRGCSRPASPRSACSGRGASPSPAPWRRDAHPVPSPPRPALARPSRSPRARAACRRRPGCSGTCSRGTCLRSPGRPPAPRPGRTRGSRPRPCSRCRCRPRRSRACSGRRRES